jgi:DNA-binding NarL/FixJ family response regulator
VESNKSPYKSRQIIILGPENLQNELLAYVLQKEIGGRCRIVEEIEDLAEKLDAEVEKRLLLVDCSGRNIKKTLEELNQCAWKSEMPITLALFSLQHGRGIEQNALQFGVRGFFYQHEKLPLIMKGVDTLFRGEIWLSREILVAVATNNTRKRPPIVESKAGLTSREMEILALVSVGANNEEIADKLFISPHTVKTHLYHIFKKISVPSRLQAALWAAKHL